MTLMSRQKLMMMMMLLMLMALLVATVSAVIDDVMASCPKSCSCYRQVSYSVINRIDTGPSTKFGWVAWVTRHGFVFLQVKCTHYTIKTDTYFGLQKQTAQYKPQNLAGR